MSMPGPTDSNPPAASLGGIAELMGASPDPFTAAVARIIADVAYRHEPPVCCDECRDDNRDETYPCLALGNATDAAFAWLLRVIEERG